MLNIDFDFYLMLKIKQFFMSKKNKAYFKSFNI